MDNQNFNFKEPIEIQTVSSEVMSKTFTARVFSWMFVGLAITGIISYLFASSPSLIGLVYETTETGLRMAPLGWVAALAPFAILLVMGLGLNKLSYTAIVASFVAFSALIGISLSSIFMRYTEGSIATIFFVTSGMFGVMAFVGYVTHNDLTKLGPILMMGLMGVIIATIVNVFIGSSSLYYMLNYLMVVIFTGFIAYDVQKIKAIGAQINADGSTTGKLAVWCALSIYLDFINLFLALLRIFGNRR